MLQKVHDDPEYFRPAYNGMVADGFSQPFEEFLRYLPQQIEKQFPEVMRLHKARLIQDDLASREQASEFVGILCLSAKNDSLPMWAHYSDNHSGAVIGINVEDAAFQLGRLDKVRYRKHRIAINPYATAGTHLWWNQIHQTVFTKSSEWSYEKEYRIVFRLADLLSGNLSKGRTSHFVHIWASTLNSIILGGLIRPKQEKAIRKLMASKKLSFSNCRMFRANRHPKTFSLAIAAA